MKTDKKFDIIVYGATGFTGKLAAEYVKKNAPEGLKWAIAGRNAKKLAEVAAFLYLSDVPQVVADAADPQAVDEMVKQTRVVMSTAGPFALYGEQIVAACARNGVHYVDITGETVWVRRMMDAYHDEAVRNKAKIVPFCGFDSIPSDVSAYMAQKYIRREYNTGTEFIYNYFKVGGGFNGGTLLSMLTMFESGEYKKVEDPAILIPESKGGVKIIKDDSGVSFDSYLKKWRGPFLMASINTRVVNRSMMLMNHYDQAYGKEVAYREFFLGSTLLKPFSAMAFSASLRTMAWLGPLSIFRKFLAKTGPKPGEGPTEQQRAKGFFSVRTVAKSETGQFIRLYTRFNGDPGNTATVAFLSEAAFALAFDEDKLPDTQTRFGFLTPVTAMGDVLIKRLEKAGLSIKAQ